MVKVLISALLVAVLFSTVPLPYSEEGQVTIASGGEWSYAMELATNAHVTFIVRSSASVDFMLIKEGPLGTVTDTPMGIANGTTIFRPTENLEAGNYRLVVMNAGPTEARISYQVHQDFIVVANMTAKNIMALSLALSMGIVALYLYGRPR